MQGVVATSPTELRHPKASLPTLPAPKLQIIIPTHATLSLLSSSTTFELSCPFYNHLDLFPYFTQSSSTWRPTRPSRPAGLASLLPRATTPSFTPAKDLSPRQLLAALLVVRLLRRSMFLGIPLLITAQPLPHLLDSQASTPAQPVLHTRLMVSTQTTSVPTLQLSETVSLPVSSCPLCQV